MRKFKLIKTYPNSPEIGFVTEEEELKVGFLGRVVASTLKDFPEYWEEVVEKDYEILSFIVDSNKTILTRRQNGLFASVLSDATDGVYSEEDILSKDPKRVEWEGGDDEYGYSIHSVKRVSDDKVFTLGDKVKVMVDENYSDMYAFESRNKASIQIAEFNIKNKDETYKTLDSQVEGMFVYEGDNSNLKFVFPLFCLNKPLFTTYDNVDIFEGDLYYYTTYKSEVCESTAGKYSGKISRLKGVVCFFSKEKAEQFTYKNKKKFSLQDIEDVFGEDSLTYFKQLKNEN